MAKAFAGRAFVPIDRTCVGVILGSGGLFPLDGNGTIRHPQNVDKGGSYLRSVELIPYILDHWVTYLMAERGGWRKGYLHSGFRFGCPRRLAS